MARWEIICPACGKKSPADASIGVSPRCMWCGAFFPPDKTEKWKSTINTNHILSSLGWSFFVTVLLFLGIGTLYGPDIGFFVAVGIGVILFIVLYKRRIVL